MGGEQDVRGFEIWAISPIAYVPSSATVPVLNNDGSARVQKIVTNGVQSYVAQTMTIPTYQLIFPGGDTKGVTNVEYRIPIFGPVTLAAFFDAGINKAVKPGQLSLNPDRLDTLNAQFPQASFGDRAFIDKRTEKIRASTGLELQIMMPVVNAPFRLYWAYNPLLLRDQLQPPVVVDRSVFPNLATFAGALSSIGSASPFLEKHSTFRFTISRTF